MTPAEAAQKVIKLFDEVKQAGITMWTDPGHLEFAAGPQFAVIEQDEDGKWDVTQ